MTKTMNIGNKVFKVCKPVETDWDRDFRYKNRTLYDCYKTPSYRKAYIWENWLKWARENNAEIFVSSYNSNFFTIRGNIFVGLDMYYIYITSTRQELYKVL